MAILRIVQPPMVTKEMYDAVNAHMERPRDAAAKG